MNRTSLAITASLGLLACQAAAAATFTDWTASDPLSAQGTLGGTSVNLSGSVGTVYTAQDFHGYGSANFTPLTADSDAVTLVIDGFGSYTVVFNGPVTDPVLHIKGLDAELTFNTAPILKVSGSLGLIVGGNVVLGSSILDGPDGSEGTVQLTGIFTTFSFDGLANFGANSPVIQIGGTVEAGGCTLVCPQDVTLNTDPGTCTASGVALGAPTVGGNCTVASLVNNAPATFNRGTTTVTWTLTDTAGNVTTCSQLVTVLDNQPPTIACQADITAGTGLGVCSANVLVTTPGATDLCTAIPIVSGSRSDFQPLNAAYPKGTTVITWTATDSAGNQGACEQTVTVVDNEPPQFTCPPDVTVSILPPPVTSAADNCGSALVTSVDVVSSSVCGSVVTRTYTVTDAAGNVTTCQQVITVGGGLFASDAILWHQPLARNGASEDTDPSVGGTVKFRFKPGSTIPIKVHVQGCSGDVTANANVTGTVEVFGDSDCNGAEDGNELPIDFNGAGGAGGAMDKIDGHLKFNLNTRLLPSTSQCYVLKVTVTDISTGETKTEIVLLQAK